MEEDKTTFGEIPDLQLYREKDGYTAFFYDNNRKHTFHGHTAEQAQDQAALVYRWLHKQPLQVELGEYRLLPLALHLWELRYPADERGQCQTVRFVASTPDEAVTHSRNMAVDLAAARAVIWYKVLAAPFPG